MGTSDQSWLWPGEQIIYWARQGCRQPVMLALVAGATATVFAAAYDLYDGDSGPEDILVGAVITGIAVGIPQFLASYRRFELVLTSHRIFYRTGLLWRTMGEFTVSDITDIKGSKAGDHPFELKLAGGGSLNVNDLPDLGRLRETLAKAVGLG